MSLYDDLDTIKTKTTEKVAGWSSGIKLLQSQLQLKKAATTQPKRDQVRKASLAPVIDLKSKSKDDDIYPNLKPTTTNQTFETHIPVLSKYDGVPTEVDWDVIGEYDPLWPNEYEKVVKELREMRDKESDERDKKRERRRKSRFADNDEIMPPPTPQVTAPTLSGFAGRWEEEEEEESRIDLPKTPRAGGGVAIAPPPSLREEPVLEVSPPHPQTNTPPTYGASSVAAKIMAKYGFKEGQGLGTHHITTIYIQY